MGPFFLRGCCLGPPPKLLLVPGQEIPCHGNGTTGIAPLLTDLTKARWGGVPMRPLTLRVRCGPEGHQKAPRRQPGQEQPGFHTDSL